MSFRGAYVNSGNYPQFFRGAWVGGATTTAPSSPPPSSPPPGTPVGGNFTREFPAPTLRSYPGLTLREFPRP